MLIVRTAVDIEIGKRPLATIGDEIYWSYAITGNEMEQSNDRFAYPATTDGNGPYEVQ